MKSRPAGRALTRTAPRSDSSSPVLEFLQDAMTDPELLHANASVIRLLHGLRTALPLFDELADVVPDDPAVAIDAALTSWLLGDYDTATRRTETVSWPAAEPEALTLAGVMLASIDRHADAWQVLTLAIERGPGTPGATWS